MKKLIYIMFLLIFMLIVGCSNENQVGSEQLKTDSISSNYQQSSENEIYDIENNTDSIENQQLDEEIDISSMIDVMEPILYRMVPDTTGEDKTYSELFSKEELKETAYLIMISRYLDIESTDIQRNYDETGHLKMERNVLNSYLKAAFNEFDNSIIDDIYSEEGDYYIFKYLESSDSYEISPSDGGGWVDITVLNISNNGDGTYKASINVSMNYDIDSECIGEYTVTLVNNNDSLSRFKYSIADIQKN